MDDRNKLIGEAGALLYLRLLLSKAKAFSEPKKIPRRRRVPAEGYLHAFTLLSTKQSLNFMKFRTTARFPASKISFQFMPPNCPPEWWCMIIGADSVFLNPFKIITSFWKVLN